MRIEIYFIAESEDDVIDAEPIFDLDEATARAADTIGTQVYTATFELDESTIGLAPDCFQPVRPNRTDDTKASA